MKKRILSLVLAALLLLPLTAMANASTTQSLVGLAFTNGGQGASCSVNVQHVTIGTTTYQNALRYSVSGGPNSFVYSCHNLNGQFTTLTGRIGRQAGSQNFNARFSFYGDGRHIATHAMNASDAARTITIDVTGVNVLEIRLHRAAGASGNLTITYAFANGVLTRANAVTGVSIPGGNRSVHVGRTVQLQATVAPHNATNRNVTWASSNTAIATVNASGLVTAVAPGNANITVTTRDGNFTASVRVTVTQDQSVPSATWALIQAVLRSIGNLFSSIGNFIMMFLRWLGMPITWFIGLFR